MDGEIKIEIAITTSTTNITLNFQYRRHIFYLIGASLVFAESSLTSDDLSFSLLIGRFFDWGEDTGDLSCFEVVQGSNSLGTHGVIEHTSPIPLVAPSLNNIRADKRTYSGRCLKRNVT